MSELTPRIYVACLAAYNNGYLHGTWIDADQDAEDIALEIKGMLSKSPISEAEEWAIHGFEDFGNLDLHEYTPLQMVSEIAQFIAEHGELGVELVNYYGGDVDEAKRAIEDSYHGEYDSEEDFAYQMTEETNSVPSHLAFYIDYQKMARDWFISDFFSFDIKGKTHVFSTY